MGINYRYSTRTIYPHRPDPEPERMPVKKPVTRRLQEKKTRYGSLFSLFVDLANSNLPLPTIAELVILMNYKNTESVRNQIYRLKKMGKVSVDYDGYTITRVTITETGKSTSKTKS